MPSGKMNAKIAVLWDEELRVAAAAMKDLLAYQSDPARTDEEYGRKALNVLQLCAGCLTAIEDETTAIVVIDATSCVRVHNRSARNKKKDGGEKGGGA